MISWYMPLKKRSDNQIPEGRFVFMEETLLLTDLIDLSILQEMQNSFSKMTGIAAYITDIEGNYVTGCSCQSDFCSRYTRSSTIGAQRCKTCDVNSAKQAFHQGKAITYHCHAGLRNFATPIIINDQLIGCFLEDSFWIRPMTTPASAILQMSLVSIRKNTSTHITACRSSQEKSSNVFLIFTYYYKCVISIAYHNFCNTSGKCQNQADHKFEIGLFSKYESRNPYTDECHYRYG